MRIQDVARGVLWLLAAWVLLGCSTNDHQQFQGPFVTVRMTALDTFNPVNINVTPGTRITWVNDDTDPHTANADLANPVPGGPNSAFAFPGGVLNGQSYSFDVPISVAPGTVWFYHCCNHGAAGTGAALGAGMSGSITIVAP